MDGILQPLVRGWEETIGHFKDSPGFRRTVVFFLLLLVAWLDYVTDPRITFTPFYILILLGLALFESWQVCLFYSGLAGLLFLAADVLGTPDPARLVYPYWSAMA